MHFVHEMWLAWSDCVRVCGQGLHVWPDDRIKNRTRHRDAECIRGEGNKKRAYPPLPFPLPSTHPLSSRLGRSGDRAGFTPSRAPVQKTVWGPLIYNPPLDTMTVYNASAPHKNRFLYSVITHTRLTALFPGLPGEPVPER